MEQLKHECGIAIVRLRKPLEYYEEKYGSKFYGLEKMYLLMEKQHNRGQEGAGLGCINIQAKPGEEYIFRERALGTSAIQEIFATVGSQIEQAAKGDDNITPFLGEVYLGHLRYSTTGKSGLSYVHPFLRRNNWRSRNLLLCGNFNLTNVDDIFKHIVSDGQHPRIYSDTFLLLEQIGAEVDNEYLLRHNINLKKIMQATAPMWDGGFVICGALGSGDVFAIRDSKGIRPAFYYVDDEICVVASERPVIQTVMNLPDADSVTELQPGAMISISAGGEVEIDQILEHTENQRCSFERIYFSRGGDKDIYRERKQLGYELTDAILKEVNYDIDNTVFSFIPNTAELAFIGMMEGVEDYLNSLKLEQISKLDTTDSSYYDKLKAILSVRVRNEKMAFKDIKLRTFIAEGSSRNDLAAHVYDVTYGMIKPSVDNVVVIDDSIVRGTTLKHSIIRILSRLKPRKIVIVSSSPQVRFPDYYGIDMSRMNEFCAFRAAVELLRENGLDAVLDDIYRECLDISTKELCDLVGVENPVKRIYSGFTDEQVSHKIAQMLTPSDIDIPVELVYQSIAGMHDAIPNNPGDWYFSGNYPTPGGLRMCARAFVNFYEGKMQKR